MALKKKKGLPMLKHHNTRTRGGKVENAESTRGWRGCSATETLVCSCWWCTVVQPLWKTVWRLLAKLNLLTVRANSYVLWYLLKGVENLGFQQKPWNCYILCGSNYRTSCKRQSYAGSKRISGCQELGGGREEWAEHRIFRAVKILCMIL